MMKGHIAISLLCSVYRKGETAKSIRLLFTTVLNVLGKDLLLPSVKMNTGLVESVIEEKSDEKPIDREKTCPLLLRVFLSTGRHHSLNDYSRGNVPTNELQIYTWMDATLKELTSLVKEVNPDARRKGTYFDFALVFPDVRGPGYRMRDIGTTCCGQKGADDNKSLAMCRFKIGDYLDIAISPPSQRGPPVSRRNRPNMF